MDILSYRCGCGAILRRPNLKARGSSLDCPTCRSRMWRTNATPADDGHRPVPVRDFLSTAPQPVRDEYTCHDPTQPLVLADFLPADYAERSHGYGLCSLAGIRLGNLDAVRGHALPADWLFVWLRVGDFLSERVYKVTRDDVERVAQQNTISLQEAAQVLAHAGWEELLGARSREADPPAKAPRAPRTPAHEFAADATRFLFSDLFPAKQ